MTGDGSSSAGEAAEIASLTEGEEEGMEGEGEGGGSSAPDQLKLNEQEWIKQHQMRKLINNLDDEVQKKEDEVNRLRYLLVYCV